MSEDTGIGMRLKWLGVSAGKRAGGNFVCLSVCLSVVCLLVRWHDRYGYESRSISTKGKERVHSGRLALASTLLDGLGRHLGI